MNEIELISVRAILALYDVEQTLILVIVLDLMASWNGNEPLTLILV